MTKEQYWRKMYERWRFSGQQITAFCDKNNLNTKSFYRWRKKFEQQDVTGCLDTIVGKKGSSDKLIMRQSEGERLAFTKLAIDADTQSDSLGYCEEADAKKAIEIKLPYGIILRIPTDAAAAK